jgi:hypothetical protein
MPSLQAVTSVIVTSRQSLYTLCVRATWIKMGCTTQVFAVFIGLALWGMMSVHTIYISALEIAFLQTTI